VYSEALSYPEIMLPALSDPQKGLEVVQQWVNERHAEDLYLDFKQKDKADVGAANINDKRQYAKAISGFANSDGGFLVWGVVAGREGNDAESPDVARSLKPITSAKTFCADLNATTLNATKPVVAGVRNILIPDPTAAESGFIVTYVPASTNPPYRAELDNNNRFYKRAGSSFYPMEPFDIRDVVFRFRYPKVSVEVLADRLTDLHSLSGDLGPDDPRFSLRLEVTNHGPSVLRDYKVEIVMLHRLVLTEPDPGLGWNVDGPFREQGMEMSSWSLFTGAFEPVRYYVYPGDRRSLPPASGIGSFHFGFPLAAWYASHLGNLPVVCRLYGVDMPRIEAKTTLEAMIADRWF